MSNSSVLSNQSYNNNINNNNNETQSQTEAASMMLRRHSTNGTINLNSNDENNLNNSSCSNINKSESSSVRHETLETKILNTTQHTVNAITSNNAINCRSHSAISNKNLTSLMKSTCPDYFLIPRTTRKRILRFLCDNGWIDIS